jgi:RNA polymerase sigma factor (sigma-70 family)
MSDLGARLAQGDREAFAELYDAWAGRLHHYLVVQLQSRADADDALQETFLRLARGRGKLASVENLTAYVFAVARNEALRLAARRRRNAAGALSGEVLFCHQESDLRLRETAEWVSGALASLRSDQREVVELKAFAGLTLAEIAAVTGAPPGTVATRYRTALDKMHKLLVKELS